MLFIFTLEIFEIKSYPNCPDYITELSLGPLFSGSKENINLSALRLGYILYAVYTITSYIKYNNPLYR